jgi:hypothetical protein
MADMRPHRLNDLSVRTEVGRKSTTKCIYSLNCDTLIKFEIKRAHSSAIFLKFKALYASVTLTYDCAEGGTRGGQF